MKKLLLMVAIPLVSYIGHAQVGINNTDPKATLDITASDATNPSNTDGILIPRIEDFPGVNPTADQQGMMVYLTTTSGSNPPGFYYWDNVTTNWVTVSSVPDADWYEENSTSPPTSNSADIFTDGNVGIGVNNVTYPLQIETSTATRTISLLNENTGSSVRGLSNNIIEGSTSSGSTYGLVNAIRRTNQSYISGVANSFSNSVSDQSYGYLFGYENSFGNSTSTTSYGLINRFQGTTGTAYGISNLIGYNITDFYGLDNHNITGANLTGTFYGVYNSLTGSDAGARYGVYTNFEETGNGNKFGEYITIASTAGGTHYGIYSDVRKSNSFAGYFLGSTSFGTGTTNRYLMPSTDGTTGHVIATDGSGNLTFSTLTAGSGTLDEAYDYGGAGAGRNIMTDNGAVNIQGADGLRVAGDIQAGQNIVHDGDADTFLSFLPDQFQIDVGGRNYLDINHSNTSVIFNEDSTQSDFRVESDNQQYMLFVDGSNDAIGIGQNNPVSPLHVGISTTFDLSYLNTGQDGLFLKGAGNNSGINTIGSSIGFGPPHSARSGQRKAAIASVQTSGDVDHLGLAFYVHGNAINQSDMVEAMRLNHSGNLGINNNAPSATLDVIGSFQYEDGNESLGYVLASDASGNATWTDPSSLSISDDDWVTVGGNIERQSGDVYIGDSQLTNNDIYISDRLVDWDAAAYYIDPGSLSRVDEIQFDNGSTANPSIRFSDTNTGFFSPSAAVTAYSANGSEAFRVQNDGELSLGLTTATDYLFSINSLSNNNEIRMGNTLSNDNIIQIDHGGERGNSLNIDVTSSYNLATRSAISAFNDYGKDTAVNIAKFTSGTFNTYGVEINVPNSGTGTEYGLYSNVASTDGYAGYFLGRVSIGTTTANNYILPSSRGTSGYVLQSNGGSATSWVDPSTVFSVSADNGLTETSGNVQLGGSLTQNTSITQGNFNATYNLTGTGDFRVQDNSVTSFIVEDSGDVGFGLVNPSYLVDIYEADNSKTRAVNISKTDNTTTTSFGIYNAKSSSGTSVDYGMYSTLTGTGTGVQYLQYNSMQTTGTGTKYAVYNNFGGSVTSAKYGVFNSFISTSGNYYGMQNSMTGSTNNAVFGVNNLLSGSGTGAKTGVSNSFSGASGDANLYAGLDNTFTDTGDGVRYGVRSVISGTGTGAKYGTYNEISATANGTHYGTYNEVSSSNGWAGYFLGRNYISERLSIGETDNATARLNINGNSTGVISHIELEETTANDGARIRFTNAAETTNEWVLYGRADDTAGNGTFNIYSSEIATNVARFESDGKVGIMRNPTTNQLEVGGTASKATAGSWLGNSDSRLKKNIETIKGATALDKITQLRGVTYEWNDSKTGMKRPEGTQYGFIAQELMKVFPEKVTMDNQGYYQTAYGDYDAIFVQAIKELNTKVEDLESENQQLKTLLSNYKNLEARLSALEEQPNATIKVANNK